MPREPRIKAINSTYHIMIRGNERKDIFLSDDDRIKFIDILKINKKKYQFKINAYCLMTNHVHFLINDGGNDISEIMKSINVSYAKYFNKVYDRIGHLFQDRFKSQLIDSQRYLMEASKYIHNNPVKANMADRPEDYEWSSCKSYIHEKDDLIDIMPVISIISKNIDKAKADYIDYVNMDIPKNFRFVDTTEDDLFNVSKYIHEKLKRKSLNIEKLNTDSKLRNELIKEVVKVSYLDFGKIGEIFGGLSKSSISKIVNGKSA